MEPSISLWAEKRNLKKSREVLIYLLTKAGRDPNKDVLLLFAETPLGRSMAGEA